MRALLSIFVLLMTFFVPASPARSQPVEGPVELEPSEPTAVDPLYASFTFTPACPIQSTDVERIGGRVAITVVQAEACPATIYPPEDLRVELGTLSAGNWTIEVWSGFARSQAPIGPGSRAGLITSLEVEVVGLSSIRGLSVTPARPTTADPVTATIQTECDREVEIDSDPAAFRHTLRLIRLEVFRPCDVPDDDQRYRFDLGPLPAGSHTLVLNELGVGIRGEYTFEVRPVAPPPATPVELRGITTEPAQPSTLDPVVATIESLCPTGARLEATDGRLHHILLEELPLGAPCGASWFAPVTLGHLDQGRHTLLIEQRLSDEQPTTLLTTHTFEVSPADSIVELIDGRYRISATWSAPSGDQGSARGHALTKNAASLWFLEPDNPELLVKVLDGCLINDRHWVYAAGLTDLEVELVVTDLGTGESRQWRNPSGTAFRTVRDIGAFAGCPGPK